MIAWGHITGELTPRPFLVGVASAGEESDVTPRQLRALQCLSKTPLAEPRPRRAVEVSVVSVQWKNGPKPAQVMSR